MQLSNLEKFTSMEVAVNGESSHFIKSLMNFTFSSPIKYRLALDIDNTMCQMLEGSHDRQWIENNFLDTELIDWQGEGYKYLHLCYPNFDRLVLTILSWGNWSVDIFSAGIFQRNEAIIPQYFINKFSKYTSEPKELYENITKAGRLQIFSSHHMIDGNRNIGDKNQDLNNYEQFGRMKKDLSVISPDISNIVIADDDRSYILGNQYPFIALSGSVTYDLEKIITYKEMEFKKLLFNPLRNAEYIMGIILACKEKIDNDQVTSLRGALDQVLQHNNKSILKPLKEHGFREWDYSPWYIEPTKEISASEWGKIPLESNDYYIKMIGWIDKANNYFNEIF